MSDPHPSVCVTCGGRLPPGASPCPVCGSLTGESPLRSCASYQLAGLAGACTVRISSTLRERMPGWHVSLSAPGHPRPVEAEHGDLDAAVAAALAQATRLGWLRDPP